jgi:hypothetical protein
MAGEVNHWRRTSYLRFGHCSDLRLFARHKDGFGVIRIYLSGATIPPLCRFSRFTIVRKWYWSSTKFDAKWVWTLDRSRLCHPHQYDRNIRQNVTRIDRQIQTICVTPIHTFTMEIIRQGYQFWNQRAENKLYRRWGGVVRFGPCGPLFWCSEKRLVHKICFVSWTETLSVFHLI